MQPFSGLRFEMSRPWCQIMWASCLITFSGTLTSRSLACYMVISASR